MSDRPSSHLQRRTCVLGNGMLSTARVRGMWLPMSMIAAAGLAGCTVGPDYHRPEPTVSSEWTGTTTSSPDTTPPQPSDSRPVSASTDLRRWWATFHDDALTSLVDRALANNLDLRQAELRVRQARAERTIAGSGRLPTLDASASATRSRSGSSAGARTGNSFRAGFDASWEIDIFGGTRRTIEAAEADIQSSIEDLRDVQVTLAAEVATTYFDLRASQRVLATSRSNLQAQRETAAITKRRFEGGFVSRLDVANAEGQVAATRSQIPSLETSIRQSIFALAVLLGQQPAALLSELEVGDSAIPPVPIVPPEVPVGLPSDVLRRRPDIRRAEADLHGATARIGVATSDFFPKFSLNGGAGLQGDRFSSLSAADNRYWSIGPSITWPILSGGRIAANVEVQKVLTDQRYLAYQQTVLVALRDVESALVAYTKEQQRHAAIADSVVSNREAVKLSMQLYTGGKRDFLNVLSAQRSLLDAESSLALSEQQVVTNLVALYKALGGGWEPDPKEDRPSDPPSSAQSLPAQ